MQIIVNATFLINTLRTEPDMLRRLNLATIKNIALEVENELGIDLDDFNIEILQIEPGNIAMSDEKRQQLSTTDMNLLKTCYKLRKQCILVSDDQLLKNTASENSIKCYTTPEFAAYLLKKGKISRQKCTGFLNVLRKIYIRAKDIDKILKRIEGW